MGDKLRSPPDVEKDEITVTLPREDYRRLQWLLGIIDRMEGWCSVNRAIGKYLIIGAIGVLIFFSQGWDAFRNLFGWKTH